MTDSPRTIITGGADGVGFAIAQRLAADGGRLALMDDPATALSAAAELLSEAGAEEVLVVPAQLTDEASAAEAFDIIADHWPRANALINISPGRNAEVDELVDERAWARAFDSGLVAVVRSVRFALPLLSSAPWGRIVTVLDTPVGTSASESAVASALMVFSKRLARRVRGHGILVNVVSPTALLTGDGDDSVLATGSEPDDVFDTYVSLAERAGARITFAATATAEEVAEVAVHCASARNRFMTGQHITVDRLSEHASS